MADVIISPNMSLPVPVPSVCPGPAWATDITACMSILDQHNHAPGSGVLITQNGINLTPAATTFDSLGYNTTNAFNLRSIRFSPQGSALALGTDIGCLYEAGVDLYYNDGNGNQIRLTQSGSPVGGGGSITGLPSGTASASYSAGKFVWQSATSTAANMDAGSYIFRNGTALSKGLTLSPPNAMAANYALTLPAIPAGTSFMTLDTSGNMSGATPFPLTAAGIASATITGTQIASNVNLPGKLVQAASQDVVVSVNPASGNGYLIVAGVVNDNTLAAGDGWTVARPTTGVYNITFTTGFGVAPFVTATSVVGTTGLMSITSSSTSVVQIERSLSTTGAAANGSFHFIAVGQRA